MENENSSIVPAHGPFEAYLAQTYASATNDFSVHHYSVPAYQAATSGIDSAAYPPTHSVGNIGDLSDSANRTWAAFEQSMPQPCDTSFDWPAGYDIQHNPFIMFTDIASNVTRCDAHDLTWSSWTTDVSLNAIPNYSFVTPNTTDDDHNSSIPVGDAWLQGWLSPLINDSAIFSNTAFIITYDESAYNNTPAVNGSSGGQVYTVVVSPYSRGLTSDAFYNTYSVLTTAEWLLGLPSGTLGNDSWTLNPPMRDLFTFPTPPFHVTFAETGLPSATNWSVAMDGVTRASTTAVIAFSGYNGTYSYSVEPVSGFWRNVTLGTVTVNGNNQTVLVAFVPTYTVTFSENGLPGGTSWSVTLNGTEESTTTPTVAFSERNGSLPYVVGAPTGYTVVAGSGIVMVSGSNLSESVTFDSVINPLHFVESGLPAGTSWSVSLGGVAHASTTPTITLSESNGVYSYTVTAVRGYSGTPSSGSVTMNGTSQSVPVTFTPVYAAVFTASGLPTGTSWSVKLLGVWHASTSPTISISEPNGSYAYSLGTLTGYLVNPSSGTVTINGVGQGVPVTFTPIYAAAFTESGLPAGTSWSVKLLGIWHASTAPTISISEPNGSYAYSIGTLTGYLVNPSSGTVTINGAGQRVSITFTPVYAAVFTASGLPTGTSWSVKLLGVWHASTSPTISISEPNGSYAYSLGTLTGYLVNPSFGTVTINGVGQGVPVTFTPIYAAAFTESGLPAGTSWSVNLLGIWHASTAPTISISEPNGSYAYSIGTLTGYLVSPTSGTLAIAGSGQTALVTFVPVYKLSFSESGLPGGTNWWVKIGGAWYSSSSPTLSENEPNGTYSYNVSAVTG